VADLVVIASKVLDVDTGTALAVLDIAAAEAALDEAARGGAPPGRAPGDPPEDRRDPEGGRAPVDPDEPARAAAHLLHALIRHRPFGDGRRVAVMAALQFLAVNGWQADLDPPEAAEAVISRLADDRLPVAGLTAWLSPRLSRSAGSPHQDDARPREAPMPGWIPDRRKIFRSRESRRIMPGSEGPFQRFTERARSVVVSAQDEARRLNHNFIGTEHILLGLLREGEGVAARALETIDISLDAARQEVEKIIGRGPQTPSSHIPFTPRAKKVLELANREAWHLGHLYIGTEHILLGLLREGDGVACQVLTKLGANQNRVRQKVIQILAGHAPESADLAGPPADWAPDADIAATDAEIALHEELGRLHHEVARLRALLLRHGIQPDEGHQQTA
jgi:hypothetical protein